MSTINKIAEIYEEQLEEIERLESKLEETEKRLELLDNKCNTILQEIKYINQSLDSLEGIED